MFKLSLVISFLVFGCGLIVVFPTEINAQACTSKACSVDGCANCGPCSSGGLCTNPVAPGGCCIGEGDCTPGMACANRSDPRVGAPGPCSTTHPNFCVAGTAADPSFELPTYSDVLPFSKFKFEGTTSRFGIGPIISAAIPYVYAVSGILLFAYLLYGAFHLVTSFGSPKAILEAWLIIFRAVVGFIMIFASFWLIQLVERVFGLNII